MEFMNSAITFSSNRLILLIPDETRLMEAFQKLSQRVDEQLSIKAIANILREIIVEKRPELAEACIEYVSFDYARRCWSVGVSHPSLPHVPVLAEVRRELLDGGVV